MSTDRRAQVRRWKSFDGQQVQPIGAERFDRWFDTVATKDRLPQMTTVVDPQNQLLGHQQGVPEGPFERRWHNG